MYKVYNGNLLYHGCVPLNPDGTFKKVNVYGREYGGKGGNVDASFSTDTFSMSLGFNELNSVLLIAGTPSIITNGSTLLVEEAPRN